DLPVERLFPTRPQDRLARIEDRVVPLGKDRRFLPGRAAVRGRGILFVVAGGDELCGGPDVWVEPHPRPTVRDGGAGLPPRRRTHGAEHVLGGDAALEERACALVGEQRGRDAVRADDGLVAEIGLTARFEIRDAVVAEEATEPWTLTIVRIPNDLHDRSLLA